MLELWRNFIWANKTGSPRWAVSLHLPHLGSQSEHRIHSILPTCGACHIMKFNDVNTWKSCLSTAEWNKVIINPLNEQCTSISEVRVWIPFMPEFFRPSSSLHVLFSYQVFYKLLDILKFDNIVKLSTCILAQKIFNKSSRITRTIYASKGNFHRPKVRTNTGKFTFVYVASKLWETVPTNLKWLSISNFKKRYKDHLLKCQS